MNSCNQPFCHLYAVCFKKHPQLKEMRKQLIIYFLSCRSSLLRCTMVMTRNPAVARPKWDRWYECPHLVFLCAVLVIKVEPHLQAKLS